ncbi:MAG TPA: ricin-type beta-trefoil lectin domain protein [Streptosporangiaceae bacterium]|nr:ricin-type beta-trefoil lectin domain protein [Streptosporangiaceae bacterium]
MHALACLRRAGVMAGVASLGALVLGAWPATAAAGRPSAFVQSAGQPQRVDHPNVGATHSPQVLRQLAGPASGAGPVARSAATGAIAGALQGVDVASFQEQGGINWPQVASAGIQFAAIKATEGDYYKNKYALSDLVNAKAAGLSVLAYAYAIPDGDGASSSPVVQADDLISYLKTGPGGVPSIMLDIEYNPNNDGTGQCYGLSQSAMVSWISEFNAEVQRRTGQQPVIYTPPGWWNTCTGGSAVFSQIPPWTPYYSAAASSPPLTTGWGNWAFWQYTSTGTVTGISDAGHTDLDQLNPGVLPLLDPGAQHYLAGSPVDLQVKPADPVAGQARSFSATGLPRGVSISASGQITGWPAVPGTFDATVSVSDGKGVSGSVSFTWAVSMPPDAGPAGPVRLDVGGKCLNDVGNRSAKGTPADIWTCDGSVAQHWTYVQDGTLRIHGKCLTVPAGAANGWKVRLKPCTDSARQRWRLVYPRAVDPSLGGRPTTFLNRGSGKCLDDPGWSTTNGTRVVIWSCNGHRNQAWTLPAGPVASQIPGKCVDDSGDQTADGTKIDIWGCNGSAGQAWRVKSDGTVRVNGKCLDVTGSGTASGTLVDLHSCNGSPGQQWHLVPEGAGAMLANPHSGLCLADPADATANGTQLEILGCSAGDPGTAWRVS